MDKPVLQLEGLSKFYTSAQNVVVGLNNVNLSFHRGEFVAITGESGSGKSTLAHVVGGILPYEGGELYFDGKPTSHFDGKDWEHYRRDNISFISQSYGILLSATVLENVVSALRLTGMEKKDAVAEAEVILKKVELWQLRRRRAAKLSSGQKQRLSIARALAKPAPILIADEPTGNLDPENSAKVISLLQDAARDRLVLLITHDFQEAEGCATRRISLQDGRIVMDAALQIAAEPAPLPKRTPAKKKPLSLYVSRLQLAGRPVWSSLVLLFFTLTAFAVFAFLGTFIVALDDTGTRRYDDSAFRNGDPNRIVVQKIDGAPMTQEDYDALLRVEYVSALDKHSFLQDINCLYIKDEHYRSAYTLVNVGSGADPVYIEKVELEPLDMKVFAQSIPLLPEGQPFLTAGRLPENAEEVVIAGEESRIGETFTVFLLDEPHWALNTFVSYDVTVVGVTAYGEGIYLHDDIGRVFSHCNDWGNRQLMLMPSSQVAEGKLQLSAALSLPFPVTEFKQRVELLDGGSMILQGEAFHTMTNPLSVLINPADFNKVVPAEGGMQVSLTISNYAYTSRVLKAVQDLGYIAVSPYQMGATIPILELVNQRTQTLVVCAAALAMVVLLQVIVLRALFGSEIENFRLLANIGLSCTTAKASIFWQILLFTLLGQGLGFAALWYCNDLGVERIVSIIRYLPTELMALLSAVHLLAAVIAALWIARTVQKRVYPLFANHSDLAVEEEEEVAK